MNTFHPSNFFDLSDPTAAEIFADCDEIWDALKHTRKHVERLTDGAQTIHGDFMPGAYLSNNPVYIAEGAVIEPGAYIEGPAYIGAGAVVRHGAFVRADVILLAGAILGHASEAKNAIFLPHAHAPHFNYVGDSILGNRVNLGAGTKLSNLAMNSVKDPETGKRPTIQIPFEGEMYDTGLAKLGAIMGDDAQTGCNSVLNPGCIIGPRSMVYANLSLRKGFHPPDSILKLRQKTSTVPFRR